jgi:hypothetical protein
MVADIFALRPFGVKKLPKYISDEFCFSGLLCVFLELRKVVIEKA